MKHILFLLTCCLCFVTPLRARADCPEGGCPGDPCEGEGDPCTLDPCGNPGTWVCRGPGSHRHLVCDAPPCPCVPTTSCAAQGRNCDTIWNGCATVSCGTCTAPLTCGGGGAAGQCGVPPISRTAYAGTQVAGRCGVIFGRWDAPRGALVLTDSHNNPVKAIVGAVGEQYTHEFVVESPDYASHSSRPEPREVDNCTRPLDQGDLEAGNPGMTRRLNMGAVYAQIYGSGDPTVDPPFGEWYGNERVIWLLGDVNRANAIANGVEAAGTIDRSFNVVFFGDESGYFAHSPYCEYTPFDPIDGRPAQSSCVFPVDALSRNGQSSPYVLYQFTNIEGTHLGPTGSSRRNGSMSASYCAYAYALGGPPMSPFPYGHDESANAAYELESASYRLCRQKLGSLGIVVWAYCGFVGEDTLCSRASNMVTNCMANDNCSDNSHTWQQTVAADDFAAWTISPDRLGGKTRFADEVRAGNPPTTWAADTTQHWVRWNAGGAVFGCWH